MPDKEKKEGFLGTVAIKTAARVMVDSAVPNLGPVARAVAVTVAEQQIRASLHQEDDTEEKKKS